MLLRIGAVAGIVGAVLEVWLGGLHAGHTDPNDSAHVFTEYAASGIWTPVHIGQYAGAFLIVVALVVLARSIESGRGLARSAAVIGLLATTTVIGVFAVQMAVDGVVLREAVKSWVEATPADKPTAFLVAETVRWLEKGLSAFFHLNNGVALLALGVAVAAGRTYPRWIGATAIVGGLSFVAGGVVTADSGFSSQAATVLAPASLALAAFFLSIGVVMWRRASAAAPIGRPASLAEPNPAQ
jgi:hypothetical protein